MRISLTVKCVAYLCAALVLLGLGVMFSRGFSPVGVVWVESVQEEVLQAEALFYAQRVAGAYTRAMVYVFIVACTLLGAVVYGWRGYIRRHREHRTDALLWLGLGVLLLAYAIYAFLSFDLGNSVTSGVSAAVELMRMVMRALPVPFAVRALTVAMSRDMPPRGRLALRIVGGVLLLGTVILLPPTSFQAIFGG